MAAPSATGQGFAARLLTLAGGTLGSQLVLLAVVPLVTRLYSPEQLGLHAVFAALLFVLMALAGARYEYAIALVESPGEARALLRLCGWSALLVAGCTALATLFLSAPVAALLAEPALADWLPWVAPVVLAGGLFQALNYALVRDERFAEIALGRMAQALGTGATWIGAGIAGFVPGGLFVGELGGRALSTAVLARAWARRERVASSHTVAEVARKHWRYPVLALPASLLNLLSVQLPPVLLAIGFQSAVVGWFALAVRLLQAPVRLLAHAAGQVFMAQAGRLEGAALEVATETMLRRLARMALGGAALAILIAPDVVAWCLGERWRMAGVYAQLMAPWLALVFIGSPLTSLIMARGRQRAELIFQAVLLLARVGVIVWASHRGEALLAVQLYGLVGAVAWAPYLMALPALGGVSIPRTLRILAVELAPVALSVLPAVLAIALAASPAVVTACAVPVAATWGVQLVRALRDGPPQDSP